MNERSDSPKYRYDASFASTIEQKWQGRWEDQGTYYASNPSGDLEDDSGRIDLPNIFIMDMFPYPSGAGLHVGHPLGFIGTDVFARYKRMTGYNVLHTMGYDAFGLPAEEHARQTGQHPRDNTNANIENMRKQLRRLGLGHDSRRSVSTTDLEFYKWTQWIFLQLFNSWYDSEADRARPITELESLLSNGHLKLENGTDWNALTISEKREIIDSYRLAYLAEAPVNWCPALGTVLANEEVTAEGRSERGNHPVFRRPLKQWMMRITAYADRLLDDLEILDWSDAIKTMQRNWIGKSEGAEITFKAGDEDLKVFTTRPDTLFGATYMVLAPEHPLINVITSMENLENVKNYVEVANRKSEIERTSLDKNKTGVFTGAHAVNPITKELIPIWIADYVVISYGTGAIMAVPSGDERDFEFAKKYELPIVEVVSSDGKIYGNDNCFTGEGIAINSGDCTGKTTSEAKEIINQKLIDLKCGSLSLIHI